ncbi:hypothetical protein D3C84_1217570 [compost metagenome]
MGGQHRSARVEDSWPRNHSENAWFPCGSSVSERHVGTGLLVPGTEDSQAIGITGKCVSQTVDLSTGECKDRIYTMGLKTLN